MKKVLTVAALAVVLAGCSSAPHNHPAVSPSPATMTLLKACQVLRADILANGGQADRPTLERVADEVQDVALSTDARTAEKDVGSGGLLNIGASLMAADCRPAGVQIPVTSP